MARRWFPTVVFALAVAGCSEDSPPASGGQDAAARDNGGEADAPAMDAPAMDAPAMDAVTGGDVAPDLLVDSGPPRCARDEDCAAMTNAPACDTNTGRCVACTPSGDRCPAGQYCVAETLSCAQGCANDQGCRAQSADGGASTARCETATHTCVACLADDDCTLGQRCMGNACVPGCTETRGCPTGSACCAGACVDITSNAAACGGCGMACSVANAMPACAAGACAVGACTAPFGDCDSSASNGCETDTATSLAHCGGCGRACATRANASAACAMGACAYACNPSFGDCDNNPANGCEVNTATDVINCGGCGVSCATRANATSSCAAGACAYACNANFGDCDGDPSNGCETDLRSAAAHCGTCGRACTYANAAGVCDASACRLGACNAGFANCNGNAADGCEISTASDPSHCGACSNECPAPRAVASCSVGVCGIETCETNFGNCDAMASNGCEVDLRTSNAHCGACGTVCPTGQVCSARACAPTTSCAALHAALPALPSGEYDIRPAGSTTTIRVYCDMTSHGGGWTLIGSVVNGAPRVWTTLEAFTNSTAFGSLSTRTTAGFKSPAWSAVAGADLMVQTDEYAFGFRALLNNTAFGPFITAGWPTACREAWTRSGVDFATNLSADQQRTLGFTLRARDSNAACFPTTNENAAVVFHAAECCWVNGLGNTPAGQVQWSTHDLSLLRLSNLRPLACTAGVYPCNANGFVSNSSGECYGDDPACKSRYALIYVR